MPITDWGDWIKEFGGESGAWVNLGCHPDHYDYNVCCQKDYLHSMLCFAMSTNYTPMNDVKKMHLYSLDIITELQRQISVIYDLLNKYYSPPLCVSWHYTNERKIRELVVFAANAAKNGIPNLSQGIEPELYNMLTSPSTSLFRLINLVCNRALSDYSVWGNAQKDEDFLKILCSVYERRLLQYRQAAIDCGWIIKVHESVQTGTKTEYCQRSLGMGPEIDCESCIEWGQKPRSMCNSARGIPIADLFVRNYSILIDRD